MTRPWPTLIAALICLLASVTTRADEASQDRSALRKMRQETLTALYRAVPASKKDIRTAAGYGVFVTAGPHLFALGGSGGAGVVRDNLNGRDTYLRTASVGGGAGLGVQDRYLVLIVKDRETLKTLLNQGATFGAGKRRSDSGRVQVAPGVSLYQLTMDGTLSDDQFLGTKFWKDDRLN